MSATSMGRMGTASSSPGSPAIWSCGAPSVAMSFRVSTSAPESSQLQRLWESRSCSAPFGKRSRPLCALVLTAESSPCRLSHARSRQSTKNGNASPTN